MAQQKFRCETRCTGTVVLTFFSPVKIDFHREISWCFSEKTIVFQRKVFIMSKKFHACFAEKKWLLFMVNKKYGELTLSHL